MKITSFTPTNYYDCMFCKESFVSPEEKSFFWFCSEGHKLQYALSVVCAVFPTAPKTKQFALSRRIAEVSLR